MANRFSQEQTYEQSQFEFWAEHFTSDTCRDIVANLSDAIYYSVHDQKCNQDCPENCRSKMDRFDAFNGEYLNQLEENIIAQGGFGRVYPGIWHGKEAAFKFVPVGKMTDQVYQEDMQSDLETNILEYTIQYESKGDSVLIPIGNFRQQTQQRNSFILNQSFMRQSYVICSTLTAVTFLHYRVAAKMALEILG